MCNQLHPDSTPIKETGRGYKVFTSLEVGEWRAGHRPGLSSMCIAGNRTYPVRKRIVWAQAPDNPFQGFCFFLDLEEARKLLRSWNNHFVILPIKYRKGLGAHVEDKITEKIPFKIALCKGFTILTKKPL
jgi:hypothetical protein